MRASLLAAVIAVGLGVAGCGGGSGDEAKSSGAEPGKAAAKSSGSDAYLTEVKATVDRLMGPKGTYTEPPTTSPKPAPGKKVWLISCGQSITACSVPVGGAADAAKSLGWETHVFDTKADYTQAARGIRSAIVDKADGIFIYFIDCQYIKAPLAEAKKAGIPVVGAESVECSKTDPEAEDQFAWTVLYSGGPDGPYEPPVPYDKFVYDWGRAQAKVAIAKLEGKADIITFNDDTTVGGRLVAQAYKDEFAECSGCKIEQVTVPYAELATSIRARVSQALLKNPKANAVAGTYDAVTLAGVAEGAAASGRKLVVMEGEATTDAGMDLTRTGKATAGAGVPLDWEAYSAIDALNRIFNDEEPVSSGIGIQAYDKDHNVPPSGPYRPPVDFRSLYEKAWGVG